MKQSILVKYGVLLGGNASFHCQGCCRISFIKNRAKTERVEVFLPQKCICANNSNIRTIFNTGSVFCAAQTFVGIWVESRSHVHYQIHFIVNVFSENETKIISSIVDAQNNMCSMIACDNTGKHDCDMKKSNMSDYLPKFHGEPFEIIWRLLK